MAPDSAAGLTVMQAHLAADCPDRVTCWAKDIHDAHQPDALGYAPEVDARLNALLRDLGESIGRLYRRENVGAPEAIPLLERAFKLTEAACGFSSLGTVEDVLDAIDEAI